MHVRSLLVLAAAVLAIASFSPRLTEREPPDPPLVEHGIASYYADSFQGKKTASGVPQDQSALTAASKELPLGTRAVVTNLDNGETVQVEVNDRGPYISGRVIDLSKRAAREIGIDRKKGVARVEVDARPQDQPNAKLKEEVARINAAKHGAVKKAAAKKSSVNSGPAHLPTQTAPTQTAAKAP